MQHQVIVTKHVNVKRYEDESPKSRRVKIGFLNVDSKAQAEQISDVLRHRCNLNAEPVIKMWQPGGGSVTLDYIAVERLLEEYTSETRAVAAE